jgi:hypothetical protein
MVFSPSPPLFSTRGEGEKQRLARSNEGRHSSSGEVNLPGISERKEKNPKRAGVSPGDRFVGVEEVIVYVPSPLMGVCV